MNIGNKYSDEKLYRGIKVGNGLPLLAEDIHEFSDTISNKNRHLLNSILGSGLIKEFEISYDSKGVSLNSPAILNIEGDICIIKNSTGKYLTLLSDMYNPTSLKGNICVVGWYQNITSYTTMREYGGVSNKEIPNDLLNKDLNMQVSTRYQFRWDIAIAPVGNIEDISSITIPRRDANGNLLGSNYVLNSLNKKDSIYITDPPAGMNYVVDKIYIIPIIEYTNIESSTTPGSIRNINLRRPNSTGNIIKSTSEPTGRFYDGQEWFNPETLEFRTYVENVGFVANTTKTGFIRYRVLFTIPSDDTEDMDLTELPIINYEDILEIIYEGLQLSQDYDYYIYSVEDKPYPLIHWNIPVKAGEKFSVNLTRLVEANNVTSLTNDLTKHINKISNSITNGHVKLSDATNSDSSSSSGVAATPKAVKESKILKDTSTSKSYKFSVENGILYIENIATGVKKTLLTGLS